MAKQIDRQWPDIHRRDPYPFKDTASLRSNTGELTIDPRWFVEARFWPVTNSSRIYLRTLGRSGTTLSLQLADESGVLAQASVEIDSGAKRAVFYDSAENQVGYLQTTEGGFLSFRDQPEGSYRFNLTATEFVPTAVTPQVRSGVTLLRDDFGSFLTGGWRMVGGEGVELSVDGQSVRVDLVGDGLYRRDVCENPAELGLLINPVRAIHWQDLNSGHTGVVRPKRGRIVSAIKESTGEDGRARGHQSPGPNNTIVEQMG